MNKLMYSVKEAAQTLGVSESTVRALIKDKTLPAKKIGSKIVIDIADLEAFVASLATK